MKHINFKQPKYILPAILYLPILGTGYAVGSIFTSEVKEKQDPNLKTTEYLNSDLPDAVIDDEIGSKRKNLQDVYGNITDHSGVDNIDDDRDSIRKKEEYDSRYSESEIRQIEFQKAQEEQIKKLKEQNAKLQEAAERKAHSTASSSPVPSRYPSSSGGSHMSEDDFPLSASDRERINQLRKSGKMSDMERNLTDGKGFGRNGSHGANYRGESQDDDDKVSAEIELSAAESEKSEEKSVFKKVTVMNKKFNTLAANEQESTLIKAIVDEEIKVVDGSRVRLRILDDIMIDGVTVRKGSYLYATMSGFSKQRIKGTVSSIMVKDEIHKINLSVYDTDGLEGLYVPESSFRSTAQDVASSAINTNMNMNNGGSSGDNIRQWAQQGLQQSYQRVTGAISKIIKKNKVRIKYGTHIYLVNANNKKQRQK